MHTEPDSITTHYSVSALDTLFFRESRPMETIGGSERSSVFPPPPRTLLGAVRTAIGDMQNVDWNAFGQNKHHELTRWIGHGGDLGPLKLSGLWLRYRNSQGVSQRLYPIPSWLLHKQIEQQTQLARLHIGPAVETNLGKVRLPQMANQQHGFAPYQNAWVTHRGFATLLTGALPDPTDIIHAAQLYEEEPRLGIARDNGKHTVTDGALYQTRHLRPKSALSLEISLQHLADMPRLRSVVKLGGEGRMAHISPIDVAHALPQSPQPTPNTHGFMLCLLSPACFRQTGDQPEWLPPGFSPDKDTQGTRFWHGSINGIHLNIHSAVFDKPLREGGWDMAHRRPRPVQSLLPPGSCFFVTLSEPEHQTLELALDRLHGARVGEQQELGRGLLACGLWNNHENLT